MSALAARRLITLLDLANALSWSDPRNLAEIAEELWVDLPTLRIRLTNLTAAEVRRVGVEVGHRWPWHCDA
ncbi:MULTISPECIES: hypothetical protein [Nocardia]|uniref:hypothetical protein n=1 Tax=Nocardia TaxID=1817 RepID=UPI000B2F605E|nr:MULTISPECIES: hypothetical protein [Nocardia]